MGEMERDCLITHGCANFIRDRFFCNSDQYRIHICERCGLTAQSNLKKMTYECRTPTCVGLPYKICQVEIPYACKLLFQELQSMCISPRVSHEEFVYLFLYPRISFLTFEVFDIARTLFRFTLKLGIPGIIPTDHSVVLKVMHLISFFIRKHNERVSRVCTDAITARMQSFANLYNSSWCYRITF